MLLCGLSLTEQPALCTREQRILHAACPCRPTAACRLHQLGWAEVCGVARRLQAE